MAKRITPSILQERKDAYEHFGSYAKAAEYLGISWGSVKNSVVGYHKPIDYVEECPFKGADKVLFPSLSGIGYMPLTGSISIQRLKL